MISSQRPRLPGSPRQQILFGVKGTAALLGEFHGVGGTGSVRSPFGRRRPALKFSDTTQIRCSVQLAPLGIVDDQQGEGAYCQFPDSFRPQILKGDDFC